MFCCVYRSNKKENTYLYIKIKDNFDDVPNELLDLLQPLVFVMAINLSKREKLARVDINQVKLALQTDGFYLQLPPVLETTNMIQINAPYLNRLG